MLGSGLVLGAMDGATVGPVLGNREMNGLLVGEMDGCGDGTVEGSSEGTVDGIRLGGSEGR